MPTVVVVDDAHWADPNVIRLMRRVLAHPTAPVLLVATTWPEKLGAQQAARDETGLAHVVAANRERATVVELDHLGVGALADLVREMAPRTAPDVVAALCDRAAGNPLALRLLLARKTAHRSIVDGAITLAVADVAAIRSDIHSLYQDLWDELPDAVQTTLCVAAMADEAVVVPLAVAGATALGVADAAACLAEAESPYRWVRVVRGPVLVFTEAVRREVARQHDLTGPELATAAAALIAEAGTIARADERSPVIGLVLETVLSLGRRGHHLDPEMAFGSALSLAHLAAERNDDVDELTAHLALVEWGGRLFVGDEARPQVHLLFGLAEVAARLGQHDLVVDSLEEAHRVAVDLAARHPDDVDARRDLAAALEHLGHLALDRRDLAAARTRLEEGMAISRSLVACDPQDDDAEDDRRELSVVLAQLGHLAVVEGDLGVARARYEEALALRTELMAGEADEQTYADMATLLSALGDLDVAVGDIAKGRERLEEGLFAARVLVMALPQPMQAMRMALLYLDQLSALDCAVGDLVGAREHAETALQVARGLAETRSETVEAVRDLLTALLRMADSGRVSGDLALSRDCSDEALALARELVARQPGNAIASQDLGAALSRSVTLALTVGDTAEARARIEEGMEIVTDLVERHPGSAEALNGLGAFLCCGGELEAAEGRPEAARERFEAALAVRQELVRIRPDDIGGLRVLGSCHSCLARVARDAGDRDDALVHGRRALALAVQVVTRQPTDVEARQDVVVGLDLLGELTTGAERLEHRRQGVAAAAALLDIVGPHCAAPALAADQVHDLLDALPDDADLGSEEVVVALRLAARAREHGAELSPSVARYVDRLDPPPEPPS